MWDWLAVAGMACSVISHIRLICPCRFNYVPMVYQKECVLHVFVNMIIKQWYMKSRLLHSEPHPLPLYIGVQLFPMILSHRLSPAKPCQQSQASKSMPVNPDHPGQGSKDRPARSNCS